MTMINEQITDIVNTDGHVLVQASAGTGKTTTLIEKSMKLLKENKEILILTFSNAGVNEVKIRLKNELNRLEKCEVYTFHSFCLKFLNDNKEKFGKEEEFKVISPEKASLKRIHITEKVIKEYENKIGDTNVFKSVMHYAEVSTMNNTKALFFIRVIDFANSLLNTDDWYNKAKEQYKNDQFQYEMISLIVDIAHDSDNEYLNYKNEKNFLDFQDMEKKTFNFLKEDNNTGGHTIKKYIEKYDTILVDEYQDTSPIQEAILRFISGDNTFCVGDLKQSIYRFRGATTEGFQNRQNDFLDGTKGTNKYLTYNYRSSKTIIDFVNEVFMNYDDGKGFFDKKAALICKRTENSESAFPVDIVFTKPITGENKKDNALAIVEQIKRIMKTEVYDYHEHRTRPCRYSDIDILLRNLANNKASIIEALEENSIPYSITQTQNLLDEPVIKDLISILTLTVYKADKDFINFFHKGYAGLCDDDLMILRSENPKDSIYKAIINSNDERYKTLVDILTDTERSNFFRKAVNILRKVDYNTHALSEGAVEVSQEYIHEFIFWMSQQAETNPEWEMVDFINFINELYEKHQTVNAPEMDFEDAVKLSTIHSVKGLDSSVVILAYADERISFTSPAVSFDSELGIGIKYYNVERKEKSTTPLKTQIDAILKQKELEEEIRILYVGLTRPRDKLIIIGKEPKPLGKNGSPSSYIQFITNALKDSKLVGSTVNIYTPDVDSVD